MNDDPDYNEPQSAIARLSRDLRQAAATLSVAEARFLVDAYYAMQRDRIRAGHQLRTLAEATADPAKPAEPHTVMLWLADQRETLESQVRSALGIYARNDPVGQWALSITGIGPVITAGLLANIDIKLAPTVGHIWRFAGLDPTSSWLGKAGAEELVNQTVPGKARDLNEEQVIAIARAANRNPARLMQQLVDPKTWEPNWSRTNVTKTIAKRPWNGALKRLCYLIGESFTKVSNNPNDVYGHVYKARKDYETTKNEAGEYAALAAEALAEKNFGLETDARKHYESGKLPPARIHIRSQRYATKLFLSHLHHVWFETANGRPPPKPYVIDHLGHAHYLAPPNWNGIASKE